MKEFAHKKELTRCDVMRLLGGTLDDAQDLYLVSDSSIGMNPERKDVDAMALLDPVERVIIYETESDMHLDLPCRPEKFYAWWIRNKREFPLDSGFVEEIERIFQGAGLKKEPSKDERREAGFRAWIDEQEMSIDEITRTMTKNEIQAQLIKRNKELGDDLKLWVFGFSDWWKRQKILKLNRGRRPGK